MRDTLRWMGPVPILRGVTPIHRLLSALLPLGLFALWLVPASSAAPIAPTVHAVQTSARTVALRAAPGSTLATPLEAEAPADDPELRDAAAADEPEDHSPPRRPAITPDAPTRARSDGPIYRVRRSGQAHRSAP